MRFIFFAFASAVILCGCDSGPTQLPSPAETGYQSSGSLIPVAPLQGMIHLAKGGRLRFDEATSRLKLVSLDESRGEATVVLLQKSKPDEARTIHVGENDVFKGWPVSGRLHFDSIKQGEAHFSYMTCVAKSESSLPGNDGTRELISFSSSNTLCMMQITIAPNKPWATEGLSGELQIVEVDAKAGRVNCRFVYDTGSSPRNFTLRSGYKLESNGLSLGLYEITPDGKATIARF